MNQLLSYSYFALVSGEPNLPTISLQRHTLTVPTPGAAISQVLRSNLYGEFVFSATDSVYASPYSVFMRLPILQTMSDKLPKVANLAGSDFWPESVIKKCKRRTSYLLSCVENVREVLQH